MRKWLTVLICVFLGAGLLNAQDTVQPSILLTDTLTERTYNPSLTANQIRNRSAMVPGWGQWTNNQAWKAPFIWAGLAVGVYGIIKTGQEYRKYNEASLIRTGRIGDSNTVDDYVGILSLTDLLKRSGRARTLNTASIFFTVYSYGINVFDAYTSASVVRDQKVHPPVKAAFLSALLPGLGQAYNRKYWKVPLAVAAVGTGIGFIIYNTNYYNDFRFAYINATDGDPSTTYQKIDTLGFTTPQLSQLADEFRRNRDLSYIATVALYALNIIDAIVDGHLYNFDMSDDLSNKFQPTLRPNWEYDWGSNVNYPGISLKMRF